MPAEILRQSDRIVTNAALSAFRKTNFTKPEINGSIPTAFDFAHSDLIGPDDVQAIVNFYHEIHGSSNPIFNPTTQKTLDLVQRYCLLLGQKFNDNGYSFNLYTLQALGLLHDIGRTVSHRRRINDRWGEKILSGAGFNNQFTQLLPTEGHWWPVRYPVQIDANDKNVLKTSKQQPRIDETATKEKYQDISPYTTNYSEGSVVVGHIARGIVETADVIGKIKKDGEIMTMAEFRELSLKTRQNLPNNETMWHGEYVRQLGVVTFLDEVNEFYKRLFVWVESSTGGTMDQLVDEMKEELKDKPLIEHF